MSSTTVRTPRLHRLDRLAVRTPLYFLTCCTHHRLHLLANDRSHAAFAEFCAHATGHGVYVGRYVLMPDHAHFFASFADASPTLSMWIKSLKNSLSKVLRTTGQPAPHWQKGFFDHVMRSADSYTEKWDYVRANPVRAGLVVTAGAWPYQGSFHDLRF